jgi:hypothetical protein
MKFFATLVLGFSLLIGFTPAQASSNWYPSGYTVDASINPNVAFKAVPSNQTNGCTWCSARHGFNYWKVDFIAKKTCPNFYMNSSLYSQTKSFEGTWYQKGYYQSAMKPFRLEIVTTDPHSYYVITQIIC